MEYSKRKKHALRLKSQKFLRNNSGSELVQSVLAGVVLIPLTLFFIDAIFVVLASTCNSDVAKLSARAASNEQTIDLARSAAEDCIKQQNSNLGKIRLVEFERTNELVKVLTKITIHVPAPFPFFDQVILSSGYVVEPVVYFPKESK